MDLDQAVKLIRDAGGIATIAHYATAKKAITPNILESLLKDNRLDGMETVYGLWKYGTDEEQDMVAERQMVKDLVQKYNKLKTGGADAHSERDYQNFAEKKWFSGETEGMVEEIIARVKPDLSYSTL